jgi:sirohydrochlorin cobaltochelatase
MTGLLLFAHGARDLRWREPFDRLKEAVSLRHPGPVELAFLESMQPDLGTAACRLKDAGAHHVVVVPLRSRRRSRCRRQRPSARTLR